MKKIYFFLLFTFYAIQTFAQQADVPFEKNNFPKEQKKQFKEAMDVLRGRRRLHGRFGLSQSH